MHGVPTRRDIKSQPHQCRVRPLQTGEWWEVRLFSLWTSEPRGSWSSELEEVLLQSPSLADHTDPPRRERFSCGLRLGFLGHGEDTERSAWEGVGEVKTHRSEVSRALFTVLSLLGIAPLLFEVLHVHCRVDSRLGSFPKLGSITSPSQPCSVKMQESGRLSTCKRLDTSDWSFLVTSDPSVS